jgi:polysaccharide export outer membrane protein
MKSKKVFFVLPAIILFSLMGCSSNQGGLITAAQVASHEDQRPPEYLIQPGDQLDIKFFYNPELNETVSVRPDGKISLQLIDEVEAAGITPSRLDQVLTDKYARELKKPDVTVIVRSFGGQKVYVGGEVGTQGLIDLTAGMTPLQAVIMAGGLKETAKPEDAIVIRKGPGNRPTPIRVDLAKESSEAGTEQRLHLQPFDIVYVPKSFIAKADQFVNQYIERLLLFRGVNVGFWYGLGDLSRDNK